MNLPIDGGPSSEGFAVDVPSHCSPGSWAEILATRPLAAVPAVARVAVVAAHPDDETLAVGGLVASLVAAGSIVRVALATNGEASHPHRRRTDLADTRYAEASAAMATLGDGRIHLERWGLPDGDLAGHRHALDALLRAEAATTDLLLATWPSDGHADHDVLGQAAADAAAARCRLWWYPLWAWHWSDPSGPLVEHSIRIDLDDDARQRKAHALACYRSQLEGSDGTAIVPLHVLEHFRHRWEVVIPA